MAFDQSLFLQYDTRTNYAGGIIMLDVPGTWNIGLLTIQESSLTCTAPAVRLQVQVLGGQFPAKASTPCGI